MSKITSNLIDILIARTVKKFKQSSPKVYAIAAVALLIIQYSLGLITDYDLVGQYSAIIEEVLKGINFVIMILIGSDTFKFLEGQDATPTEIKRTISEEIKRNIPEVWNDEDQQTFIK